jgi:hypothetical protein
MDLDDPESEESLDSDLTMSRDRVMASLALPHLGCSRMVVSEIEVPRLL